MIFTVIRRIFASCTLCLEIAIWINISTEYNAEYASVPFFKLVAWGTTMLLARVLARVVGEGQLTIIDAAGRSHRLEGARPGPAVTLRIHARWTGMQTGAASAAGAGRSLYGRHADGRERRHLRPARSAGPQHARRSKRRPWCSWSYALQRWLRVLEQYNPIGRAQRNVAHHYDLNDQLYDFFLDRDRQYSCAYFKTGDEPLEQAQLDKKRHIAAKLAAEARPEACSTSARAGAAWACSSASSSAST